MKRKMIKLGAGLGLLAIVGIAAAQNEVTTLPIGSLIDYGPGEVLKIVSCGPDQQWGTQNCKYEVYLNGQLMGGGLRSEPAERLLVFLNQTRAKTGLPPLGRAAAATPAGQTGAPERKRTDAAPAVTAPNEAKAMPARTSAAGQCPRTPYVRFLARQILQRPCSNK